MIVAGYSQKGARLWMSKVVSFLCHRPLTIAAMCADNTFRVWDVHSSTVLLEMTLDVDLDKATSILLSASGHTLAIGYANGDLKVLQSTHTDLVRHDWHVGDNELSLLAFNGLQSNRLAACSEQGPLHIVDIVAGVVLQSISIHVDSEVSLLSVSPWGTVAIGSDAEICIFDTEPGDYINEWRCKRTGSYSVHTPITCLSFTPETGNALAVVDNDSIQLYHCVNERGEAPQWICNQEVELGNQFGVFYKLTWLPTECSFAVEMVAEGPYFLGVFDIATSTWQQGAFDAKGDSRTHCHCREP